MDDVIAVLKAQGAMIVDPADIPSVVDTVAAENFLNWNPCSGLGPGEGAGRRTARSRSSTG